MAASAVPNGFLNTIDSVFYPVPVSRQVDLKQRTAYSELKDFGVLFDELIHQGSLVAFGEFGPRFYTKDPHLLKDKISGHQVYGWTAGTERVSGEAQSIFVLGARKIADKGVVFFAMSAETNGAGDTNLRTYVPVSSDKRIYATSYETFHRYVTRVCPPVFIKRPHVIMVTSAPTSPLPLSERDLKYVAELKSLPLDAILGDESVKKKCHAIGQKIFDEYKQAAGGSTVAGKEAAQRICDAIHFEKPDGRKRKQYIEFAWAFIGDEKWWWCP